MKSLALKSLTLLPLLTATAALAQAPAPQPPPDVKPISISCEECPYPYPTRYLPLNVHGQDVRMAYMDASAQGAANGKTVLLLHGNNFGGFYWGDVIAALTKEAFRVVAPDQIGYGRSSKPAIPYNLNDMAANTRRLLESLGIAKVSVVGHSMGGMAAARFATQNAAMTERVVLYNPIGLTEPRAGQPAPNANEQYRKVLAETSYASIKQALLRYVAHNPAAWNERFEQYARLRYASTLGGEWPRLAFVWAATRQMIATESVVGDWPRIQVPLLAFGGAEDVLPGSAALFQERMRFAAAQVPNGNGRVVLLQGVGHVPHVEVGMGALAPLIAFLKEAPR